MSKIQYTIRNIPLPVDQVIRKRAKQSGKSFNQTVVDLLSLQTFGTTKPTQKQPTIEDLFGVGGEYLDESFDQAMADFKKIDMDWWNDPGHTRY